MSPETLLEYALGQLDGPRRQQADEVFAADPNLAQKVETLNVHLQLLLDDGDGPEVPVGLARRTVLRVSERRKRPTYSDLIPIAVPFRWADVAVAASLFFACLLTLAPALKRSRETWYATACTNNLHQLGLALNRYATVHQAYPSSSAESEAPYAGTFALHLNEAGLLPDPRVLDCPSNGHTHMLMTLPTVRSLAGMPPQQALKAPCLANVDYAYSLGFEKNGRPGPLLATVPASFPLVADAPPYSDNIQILDGNSPNHGGAGQNVLFVGGNVSWQRNRQWGRDSDIFLNERHEPAPGVHAGDAVLAPAITRLRNR